MDMDEKLYWSEQKGREAGLAEGREAGLAEGREAGLAEGREEGLAEGAEQGRQQIAELGARMQADGRMDELLDVLADPVLLERELARYGIGEK